VITIYGFEAKQCISFLRFMITHCVITKPLNPLTPTRRNIGTLSLLGAAGLFSACDGSSSSTEYNDYLSASGSVYEADGTTKVGGLGITAYDWVVSYKDGSTVAVPFDYPTSTSAVADDTFGTFAFGSTELALNSGNTAQSCTDVCVQWSVGYEEVCYLWDTEEYCADWYGDECVDWDTDLYCALPGLEPYDYCSGWGQDCEFYYPARNIHDINSAYSEITYDTGSSSSITTTSEWTTLAPDAVISETTSNTTNKHTLTTVNETWTQADEFITPFLSAASTSRAAKKTALTAARLAVVKAHNDEKFPKRQPHGLVEDKKTGKMRAPILGRSHTKAKSRLGSLTAEQKLMIEIARKGFKATKK
jgi:hypothetical protein